MPPGSSSDPLAVRRRGALFALGLTLVYSLVTLVYLRPIWRVAGTRIAPDEGDPVFNLWVLRWGAHQIREGLPNFWDANIFFPNRGTLALSDHLFGPACVQALAEAATGNPLLGYNLLFFAAFVTTAGAVAFVVRRGGASRFAAAIAGLLLAFCPFRLGQLNHLQILLMPWLPLTLWFWDRLLVERTPRAAAIFLLCYAANVSGGSYLAFMTYVPLGVIAVNRLTDQGRVLFAQRSLRVLVPTVVLAAAVALPFFVPYLGAGRRLGLERRPQEVIGNAATLASYLSPSRASLWFRADLRAFLLQHLGRAVDPFLRPENPLFPGWAASALALVGLAAAWRRLRVPGPMALSRPRRLLLLALLAVALAAWVGGDVLTLVATAHGHDRPYAPWHWLALAAVLATSLGGWFLLRRRWGLSPVLRWRQADPWSRGLALSGAICFALSHPIVYLPVMGVVPGFDGMRVPSRFGLLATLCLVHFAARGVDHLGARLRPHATYRLAAVVLVVFVVFESLPRPLRWVRLERPAEVPPVYHWLAAQDDITALLELPIRSNASEALYMYYSTVHWKPIANGFSGVLPASHERLAAAISTLPDEAGLDLVAAQGISHLVVHDARLPPPSAALRAAWERAFLGRRLELVHVAGRDRVYRLLAGTASSSAEARSTIAAAR